MKHVIIQDYGRMLGLTSERLVIRDNEQEKEIPLRRISTITIQKPGISLSSNLLTACARHGIKVFIGHRAEEMCSLHGVAQHAVVQNRIHQFTFLADDQQKYRIARAFVYGKVRNQRATLLYFQKQRCSDVIKHISQQAAEALGQLSEQIRNLGYNERWHSTLLGLEGQAAHTYWQALAKGQWLGDAFFGRVGRGATDAANQALNYGYGILTSVVWNALINAGLEPYLGALHTPRPGKPSLVLDMMEEYRPWVVDRNVIKLRGELSDGLLKPKTRQKLSQSVLATFESPIPYHGKRLRLESALQRQCYRLCGMFADQYKYRPLLFKW
jgi:CRISP-associated protein Cas1